MRSIYGIIFLFLLIVLSARQTQGENVSSPPPPATEAKKIEAISLFGAMQTRIKEVSEAIIPNVVHIEAYVKVENMSVSSTGSGIISHAKGYILTNNHVVERAEKVTVTLQGHKKKYPAEIIGTDQQTDLAVLQIKPDFPLTPPKFGDSSRVKIGDWVIAVGNPYGLDGTVSFGIISAIQRNLNVGGLLNEFIQTDAMIDFGSSGGPLVSMEGEIIGVNSRGQGRGIGFTIPGNTALEIQNKLIAGGRVERSWLGVTIQPLERELAEHMGFPDTTGVIINQVHEGSSAEKAGLKAGDIMTHFDENVLEAEDNSELQSVTRLISQTPIGKKVKLRVLREGRPLTLETEMLQQPKIEGNELESELGFNVKEITKILFITQRLLSRKGVYVSFVEPGSVADEALLQKGDVIQQIDKKTIDDLGDFQKIASNLPQKKRILLRVQRGNDLFYLLLKNDRRKAKNISIY